jgi:hypothetical protein
MAVAPEVGEGGDGLGEKEEAVRVGRWFWRGADWGRLVFS